MESRLDMHGADKSLAEEVPLVPHDDKDTQDALNKLADEAARATSTLRPAATADFSAGPRPSLADPPVLPAADDLAPEPVQRPRAGVGRFALAVALGVAATVAWQSYGEAGRRMLAAHVPVLAGVLMVSHAPSVAHMPSAGDAAAIQPMATGDTAAPVVPATASASPEASAPATPPHAAAPAPVDLTPQIEAMARDLAALRESMARLVAAQDETTKILTKLRTEEESKPVPAPKPRPVAVRRPPPAPAPAPAPIGRPNPSAGSATVTSAPLSVVPPPPGVVAAPPRRPPAGLP
jgi:hypothetical protein